MCSNPCESEVTCFRPDSNRGPYGSPFFLSAALSSTELWWQMNHRKSVRTLISRWPSRPIWDKIPTTILQSCFVTIPSPLGGSGQFPSVRSHKFSPAKKNKFEFKFMVGRYRSSVLKPVSIFDPVILRSLCFGCCSPLVRWDCNRCNVTKVLKVFPKESPQGSQEWRTMWGETCGWRTSGPWGGLM